MRVTASRGRPASAKVTQSIRERMADNGWTASVNEPARTIAGTHASWRPGAAGSGRKQTGGKERRARALPTDPNRFG